MSITCSISEVVLALGMEPTFKKQYEHRFGKKGSLSVNLKTDQWYDFETQSGGGMLDLVVHQGKATDRSSGAQWLKSLGLIANTSEPPRKNTILRAHVYRDEFGDPIRKAEKYEDGTWRQFRWSEGNWVAGTKGVRDIPYQLSELLEDYSDRILFIFEGETDVDRAITGGLLATCNVGGAGNWKRELNQYLPKREICIVPDNDAAGIDHAQKVLKLLREDGFEAFVFTSHLKTLDDKGDFSDWMDANENNVDTFLELVGADRESQPAPEQAYLDKFGIKPADELLKMDFKPLRFLYDGLVPEVGLTLIAALPKVGKSWFVLNLAKQMLTDGTPVHYLAAEDNERRLRDRISKAFQEGLKRLTYHAVMSSEQPLPRGDDALMHIEQVARGTKSKCIIVDTVQSILNPSGTAKNYDSVVEEYDALRKLAHRLDIAIIVVHHCKKSTDVASAPLEKVIGSIGITGTAETIMVMEQLPGSKDCKLHVTGKDVKQCEKHLAWNGHGFENNDDAIAAQLGSTQKLVLMLIKEAPRCMQKYVVDAIGKDQGQVARAIDRLIELGLVVKKENRLIAQ